jgi:hypothetical protein
MAGFLNTCWINGGWIVNGGWIERWIDGKWVLKDG